MDGKNVNPTAIDGYIAQFSEEVQQILGSVRTVIKESAPEAVEKMSYNMPAFYQNGFLVSFAVWKNHVGFYPRSTEMEAAIKGLSAYQGTKGSVHFPLNKPMPYEIIAEIVKFRVAENRKENSRNPNSYPRI